MGTHVDSEHDALGTTEREMARDHSPLAAVPSGRPSVLARVDSEAPPRLDAAEIHVWTVVLDETLASDAAALEILSPAELARASKFRSNVDRSRFVQRRAILRVILGGYLGVTANAVAYTVNAFGKPAVTASDACPGLSFNTSHSEGVALIAIARSGRVGVDIERLRPVAEAESIAGRFFTRNEAAALLSLPPRDRVQGFYNAWTRKEALVKALGSGLSTSLDSFEVSVRPGEAPAILCMDIVGEKARGWNIHHMEPAAGFVGALAVDRDSTVCQYLWRKSRP